MKKKLLIVVFLIIYSVVVHAQFGSEKTITYVADGGSDIFSIDIDIDGDLDLLTVSVYDNKVAWYENLGAGVFDRQRIISTDFHIPWSIFATDLDNDGDPDILSAGSNGVVWFENLGSGLFGEPIIFSTTKSDCVFAHDIDNDGDNDVFATFYQENKMIRYENLGNGTFSIGQVITSSVYGADEIDVFDIDNDGDKDLLLTSDSILVWFENLGNGVIDTVQNVISENLTSLLALSVADINNDGYQDVLSVSSLQDKLVWFENLGNGSMDTTQNIISSINNPKIIIGADVNNDGDLDVISSGSGVILWYENLGGGILDTNYQIIGNSLTQIESLVAADIDNDGNIDVASVSWGGEVAWYKNFGSGVFSAKKSITYSIDRPTCVHSCDLDNDGNVDIIASGEGGIGDIKWFKNLGNGVFGLAQTINDTLGKVQSIFTSDIDNDGDMDIVTLSIDLGLLVWHENLGGGNISPNKNIISNTINGGYSVFLADIDNDGDDDVVAAAYIGTNKIVWHENLGNGMFGTEQIILLNANNPRSIYIADINNDGNLDILTASSSRIAWHENLGGGTFSTRQTISNNINLASSVSAADLNNDGNIDVISASLSNDKLYWHKNNGGGIFSTEIVISNNVDGANCIYSVDVDGDGDIDVLSTSEIDDKVAWYENYGNGSFSTQHIISATVDQVRYVIATDIDNDGDEDVVIAAYGDDKIAWYENSFNSSYKLKGKIFYDVNQNAIFDSADVGLPIVNPHIQPNSNVSFTSNDGNYFYSTDSGHYVVSYQVDSLWNLTTDSATYSRTLNNSISYIDSLNFGFYPDTLITNLISSLTGGFPRCNSLVNYWVSFQNIGTTIPDVTVKLQLSDSITFFTSDYIPDSIIGKNIYWNFDSLYYYSNKTINLQVQMPSFMSMGDTLVSYLEVYEQDSLNNIKLDTLSQVLVCAYDPNDKQVTPIGYDTLGFINKNQELEYLIRFQNTGNDTAITVVIKDTLDLNLDRTTFKLISSSHNVNTTIRQNGEVNFNFQNIMLPDSGINFLGSQGFVKYSISPKSGIEPLEQIVNTAYIYFDSNPAVITNTVVNTIECYSAPMPTISFNFPYLFTTLIGDFSYQWYINDTLIVGAINDTLLPLNDGLYTVEVTDSNSCSKTSLAYHHTSVSINEYIGNNSIKTVVYPNPFNETTNIVFDRNLNGEYEIVLYNILGAEVYYNDNIMSSKLEINKSDIGKGLFLSYLINKETGQRMFIEKLIVY